jgi:hypothetical protein
MASKQSALTLSKKLEMIAAVEKNDREKTRTKTQIAQDFGIPKTTLSTIIKNKEKKQGCFRAIEVRSAAKTLKGSSVRKRRGSAGEMDRTSKEYECST